MIAILFLCTVPIAAGIGAYEGYRHGRKGSTIRHACGQAWSRSIAILTLILLLLFAILGIVLLTNGHGISEVLWNITTGLLFAIIFACLATAIPAQIAAFIAHNFGTQRRIRDDLAKPPG